MSAVEYTPEWWAEVELKQQKRRDYSGAVTDESLPHIADRIRNLIGSGRRMTIVNWYAQHPNHPDVHAGLSLSTECFGDPIGSWRNEYGAGVHVRLAPGIRGFGVSTEGLKSRAEFAAKKAKAREIEGRLNGPRVPVEHYWVDIEGGRGPGEYGRDDQIRIASLNRDNVTEHTVVAFDADYLRTVPTQPWSATSDPDGEHAAELIMMSAPDHVRWAALQWLDRSMASQATADGQLNVLAGLLAGLDEKVRPWAHEITEEAP